MNTTRTGHALRQPPATSLRTTTNDYDHHGAQDEDILVHLNTQFEGEHGNHESRQWDSGTQNAVRRAITKRSSRSYSARISRQKSRKRDIFGRQGKPGITVDTSFARHRGNQPHQVFPQGEPSSGGSIRKQSWFSAGRSSTRNKGLGITKGTPQPGNTHRAKPSVDQSDLSTAISMTPGSNTWQEISPWDRRIPIGISVPTDSVSDFSSFNGARVRSGSDVTLVTPNIVITPAEAMKSVWSPDTPFTESDYTPSTYSRYTLNAHSTDPSAPPVPALPAGMANTSGIQVMPRPQGEAASGPTHNRNDTLDSNGTAFEEDDDLKRSQRIMSTGTVFEEDETPLRERAVEAPIAIDTSLLPTPRRSQGWWNVITTPFVTTPNTAVFPPNGREQGAPAVPSVPAGYGVMREPPSASANSHMAIFDSTPRVPSPAPENSSGTSITQTTVVNNAAVSTSSTQQTNSTPGRSVASPMSAMSASPVVDTAAIGTVLMPRQVEEQPRTININIELQDRRTSANAQTAHTNANSLSAVQYSNPSAPTAHSNNTAAAVARANGSQQSLPVFAPPPSHAVKGSHFSYDYISRSSSPGSTSDMKGKKQKKQKKHRKVCDLVALLPFGKRKHKKKSEEKKKKKKKGWCFWGCCCCLSFLILLAILIPLAVILTKRHSDTPTVTPGSPGTQPDQSGNSGWLSLPNYPAIPTGVSTIAQPEAVEEESGCVAPTTLWSCALPKEQQDSVKPNKPDQPNFRIQITHDNGTKATPTKRAANPVSAGAFIKSLLKVRALPSPSPAPPSDADMNFLGKTTDGNSAPFDGEDTPLFITFQVPTKSASKLKRADPNDPTNITAVIPPPMLDSDGTAAAANLLPLPSAQPLRLYNRGTDNEHYGFYTYFDRSIFLKQINGTNRGGNPADVDGGSSKSAASLRCTFSETRFLVQIWTRSKTSKPLLQSAAQTGPDSAKRPGTFPYPVTVTLDRHGGNPAKKNLYCYQMESDGTIQNKDSKKSFQFEDRAFGGNLVNGTQGRTSVTGPIDGGTGGCRCQWQNWLN